MKGTDLSEENIGVPCIILQLFYKFEIIPKYAKSRLSGELDRIRCRGHAGPCTASYRLGVRTFGILERYSSQERQEGMWDHSVWAGVTVAVNGRRIEKKIT